MATLTMARTPERSYEQRIDALGRANAIRSYRAQLKRDVKARRRSVDWLLLEPPEEILTMKVIDVLLAAPKVGRVKALSAFSRSGISPSKTVGGITARQRRELLSAMGRLP